MRSLVALFATFALVACGTTPTARSQPRAASAMDAPRAPNDAHVEALLTASANDFHAHRPPDPVRFREVRVGYALTPDGAKQLMLCGQFLPAQGSGGAEWTTFTTIETSGYEQWLGAQAAGLCRRPSITWDSERDLSASLQSRLDSLR